MTQKVVDGEIKDEIQRIAYWVNWISPDCYKLVDSEGKEHEAKEFTKLKEGKYTVVLDSYIEFSETKDNKKILKLGGVDYSYDITIKKGETTVTTSTEPVTSTTTSKTTTSTLSMTMTTEPFTFPTYSYEPHPTPYLDTHNLKVGEKVQIKIYETSSDKFEYTIEDESIIGYEKDDSYFGSFVGLKEGTTKVHIFPNETKKDFTFRLTVEGDGTVTATAATTQTTETETTSTTQEVTSGDTWHTFFVRDLELEVGDTTDCILGLVVPDKYTFKVDDESIIKLDMDIKEGKGIITALKPGTANIYLDIPATDEHFKHTITVVPAYMLGDANCDNEVSLADAVLIMQSIANPEKYGLNGTKPEHITERGQSNADVYGINDGITNSDALTIQKYMLGLVTELDPWKRND